MLDWKEEEEFIFQKERYSEHVSESHVHRTVDEIRKTKPLVLL